MVYRAIEQERRQSQVVQCTRRKCTILWYHSKKFHDYCATSVGNEANNVARKEKAAIATRIVQHIQSLDPLGRFLDKDSKSGLFYDFGDSKAMKKVTQALRKEVSSPATRGQLKVGNNMAVISPGQTAVSSSEFMVTKSGGDINNNR